MAAPNKLDKMAVTQDSSSLNSSVYDVNVREDADQKKIEGPYAKKKSTFKITSVTKSRGEGQNDADADSMDDLDETVESHTEDISSEIMDSSKYTDIGDQDTPLEETTHSSFGQEPEAAPVSEVVQVNKETSKEAKSSDAHSTQTRFKVVKIETKEPFKRGRWTCHDFLNDPSVEKEKNEPKIVSTEKEEQNSGNSSASSSVHYIHGVDDPSKNPLNVGSVNQILQQNDSYIHSNDNQGDKFMNKISQGGTDMTNVTYIPHAQSSVANPQIPANVQTHPLQNYTGVNTNVSCPVQNISQTVSDQRGQSGLNKSQSHLQSAMQVQAPSELVMMPNSHHGNLVTHTGNIPVKSQIPTPVTNQNSIIGQIVTPMPVDGMNKPPMGLQHIPGDTPSGKGTLPTSQMMGRKSDFTQLPQHLAAEIGDRQAKEGSVPHNSSILASQSDIEQTENDNFKFSVVGNLPVLTPLAVAEAVGGVSSPTKEDESGSSTVAIDNKIEQAMDLVKSHLMYAVREEVEVLKEQIKELVEKNSQLEYENSILKAAANPETLQKLSQPRQPQPPSSSS